MCTVTWRRSADAYEVLFNRDERRVRAPARPPRVHVVRGVRVLAPVDGQAGGTWLAANEHGLTAGLLNFYDADAAGVPADPSSRGLLLLDLMAARNPDALARSAARRDLSRYPAFLLLALDPHDQRLLRWDGRQLATERADERALPLSTSSFDTPRVLARRRARYAELLERDDATEDALESFHRSTDGLGGAYSVWMTRDDAWTVSFSRVRVQRDAVAFYYEPRGEGTARGKGVVTLMPRP
jgi:uncharacterized protein with NRDE domain